MKRFMEGDVMNPPVCVRYGCVALVVMARMLGAVEGGSPGGTKEQQGKVIRSYTFDNDGRALIQCACVAGVSGCGSQMLYEMQGKQRVEWAQEIHVKAGEAVDLSMACYRKRNVTAHGDGLCCEPSVKDENPVREEVEAWFGATATKMEDVKEVPKP